MLAYDTAAILAAAKDLYARAAQPNLFIKIPGTKEGLPAIEEAIFAGVPINVTLLFSREQYLAAANAFLRGIERRIERGPATPPSVPSPRCSSADGMWPSWALCPKGCATDWVSRLPSASMRPTEIARLSALGAGLQRG